MKCPVDGEDLKVQNYEADIQVDVCSCCGGVWLDRGELETIQKTIERDYSKILKELGRENILHEVAGARVSNFSTDPIVLDNTNLSTEVDRRHCPKCDASMRESYYRPDNATVIDICPNGHGLWLDAGELQKLEVFYQENLEMRYQEIEGFDRNNEENNYFKISRLTIIAIWGEMLLKHIRHQDRH